MLIEFTPNRDNPNIAKAISLLNINAKPFYLDITSDDYSLNGYCHENVQNKIERDGGQQIYGWQFRAYPYMIEAMFHSVWKSPDGILIDITPADDPNVSTTLFVIDENRRYEGFPNDHFRLNITSNPLVDQMIKLDEAFFRFKHSGSRMDVQYEHELSNDDQTAALHAFKMLIADLDSFYFSNGQLTSRCFCDSNRQYKLFHGYLLEKLIESY